MQVAIQKCEEYNLELLKIKLTQALDLIGGLGIKPTDRVFIKLNCVGPFAPEMGITTHPLFVKAVIQIIKGYTSNILIGDNPATRDIIYTLKKNGIYQIIQEENIPIFNGKDTFSISNPAGKYYSSFEVSKQMIEADVFINLPKLKTHALTYTTIAQKNLFGLVYGLSKASWHLKAPNSSEFGEMINDLYLAFLLAYNNKQIIHICDGIVGLEGEGPSTAGKPIASSVILASRDAVSLDRIAVEVMGLDYRKQFINLIANARGLGEGNIQNIVIKGTPLEEFSALKFEAPKNHLSIPHIRLLKIPFMRNLILEYPLIDYNKCVKCQECVKICPPKTMQSNKEGFPHLTKSACIRCWCCSEVCPQNAITKSSRPLLGKILLQKSK